MSHTIEEIQVPEAVGGPGWGVFAEYVAVRNAVEAHTVGSDLLAMPLVDAWAEYRDNPHRHRRHLAVREDGAIIGRGIVTTRPSTKKTGAHLMVDILPASRGAGIGSALLTRVEQIALDAGAPVLKATLPHTATADGPRIVPATGFGDLAADDDGVRFLVGHGYALEQISRISLLDTADLAERIRPLRDAAAGVAGADYRVLSWTGATPDRWTDDLAVLRTRMSTDAPTGGLVTAVDEWDGARVREHDDRVTSSGRTILTSAIEHLPTGALVGFSDLLVSDGDPVAVQEDTLVLREHRGHRLGMLLKATTAELLTVATRGVEAIVTYNAEENRPMLDVNETMGFRPIGYEGGWQKRV